LREQADSGDARGRAISFRLPIHLLCVSRGFPAPVISGGRAVPRDEEGEAAMPQPNPGPAYRQMANVMNDAAKEFRKQIDKLRRNIRDRLPPKQRNRFDKDWDKAQDANSQRKTAAHMLGKVQAKLADLGALADPNYAAARDELQTLIDLLRGLEAIEDLRDHFADMAQAFGS
jgi:hypothetical protein